mgnify:CR=1 FL=1
MTKEEFEAKLKDSPFLVGDLVYQWLLDRIVTLDIPGKPWDTPQLAAELERWKLDGRDVSLLIGGPEGLSPACKAAAEQSWSLSALTLPHPLVRVLVAESLYRAWSITTNHPYHRE